MRVAFGIDVGGTSIKMGLFSVAGELLATQQKTTPALIDEAGYTTVVTAMSQLIEDESKAAGEAFELVGIGLDVPGPVADDGRIMMSANAQIDMDGLLQAIGSVFAEVPVAVLNDANAAALGEKWCGAGRDYKNFIMITLGTGVGGGVIVDGNIVNGCNGFAGELGHITVQRDEVCSCGCGRKGCLEQYASAQGIVRAYERALESSGEKGVAIAHKTDSQAVFDAARNGDTYAQQAIEHMCDYLGFALATYSCITDPEAYLIGGGVAGSFDFFSDCLTRCFKAYALPGSAKTPIMAATLGNKAGMFGSAYEALKLADLI